MAIIFMGDDDGKKGQKKWVAKDTINRVVAIKDKQVESANKVARELHTECLQRRGHVKQIEKDLRKEKQMKLAFLFAWLMTMILLAVVVING